MPADAHYRTVGEGHLYQGYFKSFPILGDEHFCIVCRYVERSALAAKLGQGSRRLAVWQSLQLEGWRLWCQAFALAHTAAAQLGRASQSTAE